MMSGRANNPRKRPADTQEEAWVADEDRFVLRQAKKKATLRARAGRARPIDLLAVALRTIDPARSGFEDEEDEGEDLLVNPESVFDGLAISQLAELESDIDTYMTLEKNKSNYDYWKTMKLVCRDRQEEAKSIHDGSGISSVSKDLDRILKPKTLPQLEALEKQIKQKLRSDEAIDVDYWESLLKRLGIHKARAQLKKVAQDVAEMRRRKTRQEQAHEAHNFKERLAKSEFTDEGSSYGHIDPTRLDPQQLLRLPRGDASVKVVKLNDFGSTISTARQIVIETGPPPKKQRTSVEELPLSSTAGRGDAHITVGNAYDREVARGVDENEEVFATEEEVTTRRKAALDARYVLRKPRYFNRVQLGFEWNKYNQTHYDQDNPPPKVVQGYKFNIFYPDLVDISKAPTYRIERENGRRRGETLAPAGEEDTCVIRFTAGAPYEDLAFRIVDREWDYSAKRERGFKSSFDKGILSLHFQFKKIYYRK